MATQTKQTMITKQQSLVLLKNMVRIGISSICYMRQLFPDNCFQSVEYGNTKIHQLKSADVDGKGEIVIRNADAFLLTQWLERGVFSALSEQYLSTMIFSIYIKDAKSGKDILLETYEFKVTYQDENPPTVNGVPITSKDDLKAQASRFVRALVEFTNTLDELPGERWITISLMYADNTPPDYEPEFFKPGEVNSMSFMGNPIKVKVGTLKTPHQELTLKYVGMESLINTEIHQPLAFKEVTPQPSLFRGSLKNQDSTEVLVEQIPPKIDSVQDKCYDSIKSFMSREGKTSIRTCSKKLGFTEKAVQNAFKRLIADGTIAQKGNSYITSSTSMKVDSPCPNTSQQLPPPPKKQHRPPVINSQEDIENSFGDEFQPNASSVKKPQQQLPVLSLHTKSSNSDSSSKKRAQDAEMNVIEEQFEAFGSMSQVSEMSDTGTGKSRNVRRKYSIVKDPIVLHKNGEVQSATKH